MALSNFDFTKGLDFTGLGVTATAADHNNLVDLGTPYSDKGLVGETTDSALNTPVVPNAAATVKWKKYFWKRIPHSTATDPTPLIYVWNDNNPNVATYLRWVRVTADTAADQALIAALTVRVTAVELSTATALATANSANSNAANAANDAAAAVITAGSASTDATAALANAATAQALATTADANATAAATAAGSAATNASAALLTANTANTAVNLVTAIQSDDLVLALNSLMTPILHGLGVVPKRVRWVLHCITADPGTLHSAGDEVPIEHFTYLIAPNFDYVPFYSWANATGIYLRLMNGTPNTMPISGGANIQVAITLANWKARCYYSKN